MVGSVENVGVSLSRLALRRLVSMATEVSDRPDNNVDQNDTTSESSDA